MAITADDYNDLTTALGGICFALTRRLPVAERQPLLQNLVAMAHARNTAGDLRGETLLLDLAEAVASAMAGDPLKEKKALPRVCPGTREGQSRARGDNNARREEIGGLAQGPVVLSDGGSGGEFSLQPPLHHVAGDPQRAPGRRDGDGHRGNHAADRSSWLCT